jgi:hypothetical protein
LEDLREAATRAQALADKAASTGDGDYLDGAALNLLSFYTGAERMLEMIARVVDQAVPQGADWHRELVEQAAAEIPGIRPAVLRRHTRDLLDEYRTFRRVVRNLYTFRLRPERVKALAAALPECLAAFDEDIRGICVFFEQL